MSSRALLLGLLLLAAPLRAQDPVARLERRLANLHARDSALRLAIVTRDSLRAARQDLVVIGQAPQYAAVPRWAAGVAAPQVDSAVTRWRAWVGPVYEGLPPDTLRITFREDTAGMDRRQLRMNLKSFPATIVYDVVRQSAMRVEMRLGDRFSAWIEHELPAGWRWGRVTAITALSRDTTPSGIACLDGDAAQCIEVMRRKDAIGKQLRQSFASWALAERGQAGWTMLAQDTTAAPEERLAGLVGKSYQGAAADWIAAVRTRPTEASWGDPVLLGFSLVWSLAFLSIAVWRIKWRHA